MEIAYDEYTKKLADGGVDLLLLRARVPRVPPSAACAPCVSAFYKTLLARVELCLREAFLTAAAEAYRADPDPKKRLRHRPVRMELFCTAREEGGLLFVRRQLRTRNAAERVLLQETTDIFDTVDGFLRSDRLKVHRTPRGRERKKRR